MLRFKPGIYLVAAIGRNNEIGRNGELPWRLKDEFAHFRRITTGKTVVMGRKTMESLPGPLRERTNLVMTRSDKPLPVAFLKTNFENVMARAKYEPVMVIGGEEIYRQFMPHATALLLSHVNLELTDCDAFFPEIDRDVWQYEQILADKYEAGTSWAFVCWTRKVSHR